MMIRHMYGWGCLKPTGKNLRTPPRLLKDARAGAIVGDITSGIKKKRDVEEESRGGSGGILYHRRLKLVRRRSTIA